MSVYYPTFLYLVLVSRHYKDGLECSVVLEICLDAVLATDVLNTFAQTLCVRCNHIYLGFY